MHVEVLEDIMRNMERELYLLKQENNKKTVKENDTNDNIFSDEDFDNNFHLNNNRPLIRSDNASNWHLKFRKDGGISINTDILSYSSLIKHMEAWGTTANAFPIVKQPTLASLSAGGGYLYRHVLCSILRKGNFKATLQCIRNVQQRQQGFITSSSLTVPSVLRFEKVNTAPKIVSEKKDLALQLVNAYFSCRFLYRVLFHQKTFFNMFVHKQTDLESSPVVCALAAVALTIHCKHVLAIVPFDQQLALGDYYFNKARYAVSSQFDESSIETMITYLHLSLYKSNLLQPQDANIYLEIAIRIRQILAEEVYNKPPQPNIHNHNSPTYSNTINNVNNYSNTTTTISSPLTTGTVLTESTARSSSPKPAKSNVVNRYLGEYETFKRLHAGFQDAIQFIQFVNNQRGVPVNATNAHNKPSICNREKTAFQKIFQVTCSELHNPQPMPDESRQTVRAIMKERYISLIVKAVGPYFGKVRFGEDDMIPLSFLMKTEEDLKNVYCHQIPVDYRLASSIFEDNLDDVEFKKRLGEDRRCDMVSVTLAARYYQSLLALHEPFLPVIRRPPTLIDLSLIQENLGPDSSKKKRKRKRRSPVYDSSSATSTTCTLSSSSSSDEDENVLSVHALRAQEVCYRCSIIVVRLLEYQCTVLQACTIPMPSLLCAWDILIRNACLGMTEFDLEETGVTKFLTANDIQRSQEYAVRCIEVLRRGYMFNGAERDIWEYYEKIENQLLTALCQSAAPTAKYWEPVENW